MVSRLGDFFVGCFVVVVPVLWKLALLILMLLPSLLLL